MLVAAELLVGLLDALGRDARVLEDTAGVRTVVREGAQQVLARNVGVLHLAGELLCRVDDLDEVIGEAHLLARARHLGLASNLGICLGRNGLGVGTHALDDRAQVALAGVQQRLQQVHRLDGARLRIGCDANGGLQRLLGRDGHLV